MLFRLLGKTVWFVGKMTVKHVLVPIAITAGTAVVLGKLAERLDAAADQAGTQPNGAGAGNGSDAAPARAPRSRAARPAVDA